MKTSKRLLSLFLAVVMALTACSVGLVAFAQEVNPKDNKPFSTSNASKEGSVDALNNLVNEILPDVLMGMSEEDLKNAGIDINKVTNATSVDNAKSPRFYELMNELATTILTKINSSNSKEKLLAAKDSAKDENEAYLYNALYAELENENGKNDVETVNEMLNGVLEAVQFVLKALFVTYPNPVRTVGPDGKQLRLDTIFANLQDVYKNLALDPANTIANVLPSLVVLLDEVIVPVLFHDNSDMLGGVSKFYSDIVNGIAGLFGKDLGIVNGLEFDLNVILPNLLDYIQTGKFDGMTTYKDSTTPVIFGVKALDEEIEKNLPNYKFIEKEDVTVQELVKFIIPKLDASVTAYVKAHGNDAIIVKAQYKNHKSELTTVAKGLNNLSVALPVILSDLGNSIVKAFAGNSINVNWTEPNKYGKEAVKVKSGKSYIPVENELLGELTSLLNNKKQDGTDVIDWLLTVLFDRTFTPLFGALNDIFKDTNNNISKNIPIISGLIKTLGLFGEQSALTDALNGLFGLTRDSKYSFTLHVDKDGKYTGLSKDSIYYLLANGEVLYKAVKNIMDASKQQTSLYAEAADAEQTVTEVKIPEDLDAIIQNADNQAAASKLIETIDDLLSSLLANSKMNGFTVDDANGALSGVVSFLVNHFGKETTDQLINLLLEYVQLISKNNVALPNGDVDVNKIYSSENLSNIVTKTYVLLENIIDSQLANAVAGDEYDLVLDAVKGIVSPGSVVVRSQVSADLTKNLTWKDVKEGTDLGYTFENGNEEAFFAGLYDSLGLVTSVVGVLFCSTHYYDNVFTPLFNNINKAVGILPMAPATNGQEVLTNITLSAGNFLNQLLASPASTLLSTVSGLATSLQNRTLMKMVKGLFNPLANEVQGVLNILGVVSDNFAAAINDKCPTIKDVVGDELPAEIASLGDTKLTDAIFLIQMALPMIPGLLKEPVAMIIIKALVGDKVVLPSNLLKVLGGKNPTDLLITVVAIAMESGLKDVLEDALSGIDTDGIKQIIALITTVLDTTSNPTEVFWAIGQNLSKNRFTYPKGISAADANQAVAQLDNAVANIFPVLNKLNVLSEKNLSQVLSNALYTNATITSMAKSIYSGMNMSPADFAKYLTDKSYGPSYSSAANTLKKAKSWDNVTTLNWGFKDGSSKAQKGFINGLAAVLRPLNDILAILLADGAIDFAPVADLLRNISFSTSGKTEDGIAYTIALKDGILSFTLKNTAAKDSKDNNIDIDLFKIDLVNDLFNTVVDEIGNIKVYGGNGYESAIIPLLEAFMCDNVKTFKEYTNDYSKSKDTLITNILNPLFGFVNKLAAKPFDTLTGVLPNLAYFIDNNGITKVLDNLLSPVTQSLIPALKEQGVDIDAIIAKALGCDLGTYVSKALGLGIKLELSLSDISSCRLQDVVLPLVNSLLKDMGIQLPYFKWSTLASHGRLATVASAARNTDGQFLTNQVKANKGETLVAVLRYIANVLISNASKLQNIIVSIDGVKGNATIVNVITDVFNKIKVMSTDDFVRIIFYLLVPRPQNEFFDYRNFEYKDYEFTYPDTVAMEFLNVLGPMIDSIVNGLLGSMAPGGLNGMVAGMIYTDDIINSIVTGLYGAVEGVMIDDNTSLVEILAMTGIDFSTQNVAKLLTDSKYGKAYSKSAKVIAKAGSWSKVDPAKLSWNVTDRESFVHALAASLRPLFGVLDVLFNDANLGLFNVLYLPGSDGYSSAIVPLLEAFGAYNIKTQYQYREDMSKEYDAILIDIVNPLLDKVEDLLNAPIEVLSGMLPNLALFFANDGLLQVLDNLLTPITALLDTLKPVVNINSVLKALGVNIDAELAKLGLHTHFDIYDLKTSLKPIIGKDNIVNTLNGVLKGAGVAIELMPIDWLQLASHGETITDEASQAATYGSRVHVEADVNETLIAVLRYLIRTVNYKDNFSVINDLISGLMGEDADPAITDVIGQVLGMLQGETDKVLADLLGLLETFA